MISYFKIPDNEAVAYLKDKYSYCTERYATSNDESKAFCILNTLDDDEKILLIAMSEYKTCRKVAEVLETNMNYASKAIKELKEKMATIVA